VKAVLARLPYDISPAQRYKTPAQQTKEDQNRLTMADRAFAKDSTSIAC